MAKKQPQVLVVGKWASSGEFTPSPSQPSVPVTDMATMVAWAEDAFDGQPGSYSFIRKVPGALVVAQQSAFAFMKEAPSGQV